MAGAVGLRARDASALSAPHPVPRFSSTPAKPHAFSTSLPALVRDCWRSQGLNSFRPPGELPELVEDSAAYWARRSSLDWN